MNYPKNQSQHTSDVWQIHIGFITPTEHKMQCLYFDTKTNAISDIKSEDSIREDSEKSKERAHSRVLERTGTSTASQVSIFTNCIHTLLIMHIFVLVMETRLNMMSQKSACWLFKLLWGKVDKWTWRAIYMQITRIQVQNWKKKLS